jgi:hypothetical protein
MFQQMLIKCKLFYLNIQLCESTIVVCIKRKLEYKSPYLSSYVRPKIVMKTLHDLCDTPFYF